MVAETQRDLIAHSEGLTRSDLVIKLLLTIDPDPIAAPHVCELSGSSWRGMTVKGRSTDNQPRMITGDRRVT